MSDEDEDENEALVDTSPYATAAMNWALKMGGEPASTQDLKACIEQYNNHRRMAADERALVSEAAATLHALFKPLLQSGVVPFDS